MEFVEARDIEEDFRGFSELEAEFDKHYSALKIGEQYLRKQISSEDKAEFDDYLEKGKFFMFVKEGDNYLGYIAGNIQSMPRGYEIKRVGYLDSVIVAKKYRNKGVGRQLCNKFYEWLRAQEITICQLHVKVENVSAVEIYKKDGFQVDELRMWKKI